MIWVILTLGLSGLAIWSRQFRIFLLCTIALGGIVVGIGFAYIKWSENREDRLAHTRIAPDEIEIVEASIKDSHFTGMIRNHSTLYTLTSLNVQLRGEQCRKGTCEVIDEQDEQLSINVPPGQARYFDKYVSAPSLLEKTDFGRFDLQPVPSIAQSSSPKPLMVIADDGLECDLNQYDFVDEKGNSVHPSVLFAPEVGGGRPPLPEGLRSSSAQSERAFSQSGKKAAPIDEIRRTYRIQTLRAK